jgi:uncharacterized membrane protein
VAIPLVLSVPFLFDDASGFVKSILFSGTRNAEADVQSFAATIGLSGIVARLPMLGLFSLVYIAVATRQLGLFAACLLVMMTFTSFNPVLFSQYFAWSTALAPLAASEWPRCDQNKSLPLDSDS